MLYTLSETHVGLIVHSSTLEAKQTRLHGKDLLWVFDDVFEHWITLKGSNGKPPILPIYKANKERKVGTYRDHSFHTTVDGPKF